MVTYTKRLVKNFLLIIVPLFPFCYHLYVFKIAEIPIPASTIIGLKILYIDIFYQKLPYFGVFSIQVNL